MFREVTFMIALIVTLLSRRTTMYLAGGGTAMEGRVFKMV